MSDIGTSWTSMYISTVQEQTIVEEIATPELSTTTSKNPVVLTTKSY